MSLAWHRSRGWSGVWLAMAGCLVLTGPMGCGTDDPTECTLADEGDYFFTIDPPLSAETFNGDLTLTGLSSFPGENPPVIQYRFRTSSGGRFDIQFRDLGYTLPLEIDSTYTAEITITPGLNPPAFGLKLWDGSGLRYLAVNDWRPRTSIYVNGFGNLDDTGELRVFFTETGCPPRIDNSSCFDRVTNYRLDLILGTDDQVRLWNGQTGRLGPWSVHVHKASQVIAKQGCQEGLLAQNGISFFLERDGLR